jgi:hypothetical protein
VFVRGLWVFEKMVGNGPDAEPEEWLLETDGRSAADMVLCKGPGELSNFEEIGDELWMVLELLRGGVGVLVPIIDDELGVIELDDLEEVGCGAVEESVLEGPGRVGVGLGLGLGEVVLGAKTFPMSPHGAVGMEGAADPTNVLKAAGSAVER